METVADRAVAAVTRAVAALTEGGMTEQDAVAALVDVFAAATVGAADITAGYMSVLADLPAPPVTATLPDRTARDVARAVLDLDPPEARTVLQTLADGAVYDGAAQGAEMWALVDGTDIELWLRRTSPGEVCGLCVQAAMRVYKTPALRPIHNHCRCTIRPVFPTDDLGGLLEAPRERFRQVTGQLADTTDRVGPPANRGPATRSRASNERIDQ
ncbi:MAG: hypothetical protein ACKOWN_03380 [Microbacteriaceae bacterium]